VRVAAAAAKSIRSEHDETTDDHQHNRSAGRTYQHATVHRIINMSAATAGR
jgi:hypothetical protein